MKDGLMEVDEKVFDIDTLWDLYNELLWKYFIETNTELYESVMEVSGVKGFFEIFNEYRDDYTLTELENKGLITKRNNNITEG